MTRYEYLKSISAAELNKLKATGLMKSCTDFYIGVYDEFINQVNTGIPKMQAYQNTSDKMCTSEDSVIKIVWNLTKDICNE